MPVRSHIREALAQLRRWAPIAGGVVVLASLVQLLVFGFVHFTDARFERLEQNQGIVQTSNQSQTDPPVQFQTQWELAQRQLAGEYEPPVDLNRVESGLAVVLRRASQTAVFLGMIGVVGLVSITTLGCVIAGGGAVPGVEKILTATGGALLLTVATVPWNEAFPSVPIAGVFTGYERMTIASDAADGAMSVSVVTMHAVVPLTVLIGTIFITMRFASGVEEGYLLGDAAEAEDVIEREMAEIERRGLVPNAGMNVHLVRTLGHTRGQDLPSSPGEPVLRVSGAGEPPLRRPL